MPGELVIRRHTVEEVRTLIAVATRGALIEPTLARCDTEGVPSYLETQKESNLPYYHRFGYEVAEVLNINGCPPLWTMIRQPR
jgi:hypothetical protein